MLGDRAGGNHEDRISQAEPEPRNRCAAACACCSTASPAARDDLVIAVASYVTQPEFCSAPFIEVLDQLPQLARLDLLVAGGSYDRQYLLDLADLQKGRAKLIA